MRNLFTLAVLLLSSLASIHGWSSLGMIGIVVIAATLNKPALNHR